MAKTKTLRVQPISGKFLNATINGRNLQIWLVDPDTLKQGTEVSYEDGIALLTQRHPVACLVQVKGKNGKYIKQLSDAELKEIDEIRTAALQNIRVPEAAPIHSNEDTDTLKALVNTQAALLQTQAVQIDEMKSAFATMQKQLAEISKKSKKVED